eukprot:5206253-Prymnesium_polylepis.1
MNSQICGGTVRVWAAAFAMSRVPERTLMMSRADDIDDENTDETEPPREQAVALRVLVCIKFALLQLVTVGPFLPDQGPKGAS